MSEENKVYSQEEFQRELDKRITKALKTQEDKLAQKYQTELESLKTDLGSETEKAVINAIQEERKANEQLQKELDRRDLKNFIQSNLKERNVNDAYADYILAKSTDQDTAIQEINSFTSLMSTSHQQFIDEKLVGQTPITPSVGEGKVENTVDAFVKGLGL